MQVTVEAKMEHKGDGRRLYQEWTQQYTLPEKADTTNLKTVFDKNGWNGKWKLRIEAPVTKSTGEIPTEIKFTETEIHNLFT